MTYFSFSLEEFAREILDVISVLEDLKSFKEGRKKRNWWWILFWQHGISLLVPDIFAFATYSVLILDFPSPFNSPFSI